MVASERMFVAAYCLSFSVLFLLHKTECMNVANCSVSGCENGGTCLQMPTSNIYSCLCLPDWTGDLCNTKQNNPGCSSNPCHNGGSCQNFKDHYICLCDVFWRGRHCEKFKGFADSPPIMAPCSLQEYQCNDGHCVVEKYVCDGTEDCVDGSDEKYCSSVKPATTCADSQFDCGDGNCIPKERQCNDIQDCITGLDEEYCGSSVTPPILLETHSSGTPLEPDDSPLNLIDILIVSSAMLMTFMAITIFVYVRRVRRMQQRYFAAVGHPHHLHHHHHHNNRRQRRRHQSRVVADGNNGDVTTPYRLSQHSTFCHHLPPHRCPARTNLLVSYNLSSGVRMPLHAMSASDKDEEFEVPPAYSEVVGEGSGSRPMRGDETPPPAYEDLHVEEFL